MAGMKDMPAKPDALNQASAPVPPAEHPNGMRVGDRVLMAFNHACVVGDLEAAEEILAVMEKIAERRIRRFGGDRRRETFTFCHAREHLDWLTARR
jgi:hypothetical protein